jgi:hypothetical protein
VKRVKLGAEVIDSGGSLLPFHMSYTPELEFAIWTLNAHIVSFSHPGHNEFAKPLVHRPQSRLQIIWSVGGGQLTLPTVDRFFELMEGRVRE